MIFEQERDQPVFYLPCPDDSRDMARPGSERTPPTDAQSRSSCGVHHYFRHFDSLDKTYGPLGAAIGLYLWFYLSGFAVLVGGEINFLLGELRNRGAVPASIPTQTQINNLDAVA